MKIISIHNQTVFVTLFLVLTLTGNLQLRAQDPLKEAPKKPLIAANPTIQKQTTIVKNLTLPEAKNYVRVGDLIELDVVSSSNLTKYSAKDLILYINELPMGGLHPLGRPVLIEGSTFKFTFLLKRVRDSVQTFQAWNRFYRHPRAKEYPVTFSVGTSTETLSKQSVENKLELVKQNRLWLIWAITIAVGILVVILAKRSELLKETNPIAKSVFSLARTQIAWWTIIVLGSFLHLYIYTDELIDLSNSTMVLLGVSSGTIIIAKIIDYYKDYSNLTNQQVTMKSRGFILDILSDGTDGVSIHRLQFVIWTLALSFVFIRGVIRDLAMPEFPDNLLLLTGISNGTYLLLKLPENTKPSAGPAITNQQALGTNPVADSNTAPAVTSEGDVIRRDEDDMSDASITSSSVIASTPSSNQALG